MMESELRTPPPIYLDADLRFLIRTYGSTTAPAGRRLNAIENLMCRLVSQWRPLAIIDPARDLRMSRSTLMEVLEWVTEGDVTVHDISVRLAPYSSGAVVENAVPDGLIRFILRPLPSGDAIPLEQSV